MNESPEKLTMKLRALREQCQELAQCLDAILAQVEAEQNPVGKSLPLLVEGRCTGITIHAIDRFRERTGCNKSDEIVCARIAARIVIAAEWQLKPRYLVIEMLAHEGHSRFFRDKDLLFVVEDGIIVTIHRGEANRWEPKP